MFAVVVLWGELSSPEIQKYRLINNTTSLLSIFYTHTFLNVCRYQNIVLRYYLGTVIATSSDAKRRQATPSDAKQRLKKREKNPRAVLVYSKTNLHIIYKNHYACFFSPRA